VVTEVHAQFPKKLKFLLEPAPAKVVWGGRDGIKSWSVAQALLMMGAQYKLRWLCARETQQSIAESVHQLLEEQIIRLGLTGCYRVEKARIVGTVEHKTGMYGRAMDHPGVSEFVFAGLKHNVNQIKSFEALDGIWCEEANNISKHSWEVVLPTIRKEGSEIWLTFNPEFDGDDTYLRWIVNPPPGTLIVKTGYEDNRWLSEASRIKIEHLKATDPEGFRHIYGGETRSAVQGAVFGDELKAALAEGRIASFPRDRMRPVHTYWDLGYGDPCAIWFGQEVDGWFRMIDYLEDSGKTIDWYIIQLQQKGYQYGLHHLPHDGVDAMIHRKLAAGDGSRSIDMILRTAFPDRVRLAPKLEVASRINAGRMIFPQVQFDRGGCEAGLDRLRRYQWGPPNATGTTKREPLHDMNSHGADAYQTFAVTAKQPKAPLQKKEQPRPRATSAWA
jgi:phage terminase large subunit